MKLPKNGRYATLSVAVAYYERKRSDCRIFSEARAKELLAMEKEFRNRPTMFVYTQDKSKCTFEEQVVCGKGPTVKIKKGSK